MGSEESDNFEKSFNRLLRILKDGISFIRSQFFSAGSKVGISYIAALR